MRRDIYTLRATGMTLGEIGEWARCVPIARLIWWADNYVDAAKVNGFPIVVDDETRTLVGYIGSQQLRRAIGELRFTCLILVMA
jgi:chloride channel 3/4/5